MSVRFVAETGSKSGGTRGNHIGSLTIGSDDPASPSLEVTLAGYWQEVSEGNREPRLAELIEQLFGYKTEILLPGERLNSQGRIERTGDEVISPYWRLADASQPVEVQQLAAFHGCCTDAAPVFWHEQGLSATSLVLRHNPADGQTVLPRRAGSSVALARGSFEPGAGTVFGFRVASNEWSDSFRNATDNDDCSSGPGTCGQHIRFWPAKERDGSTIPNTYLMGMDYAGINYDFNDNVYLVSNVTPNEAVATSGTVRLNAGGLAVATGAETFEADQFATNGQSYTPTCDLGDIAGTTADDLYRTELEPQSSGPRAFAYNVPVPDGTYTVRLHFAEIYWGSAAPRQPRSGAACSRSRWRAQPVLTDLDIFAEVGVRAALVKTFQTTVTGNMLNIGFQASANNPMLSALEILPDLADLPPAVARGTRRDRQRGRRDAGLGRQHRGRPRGLHRPPQFRLWRPVPGPDGHADHHLGLLGRHAGLWRAGVLHRARGRRRGRRLRAVARGPRDALGACHAIYRGQLEHRHGAAHRQLRGAERGRGGNALFVRRLRRGEEERSVRLLYADPSRLRLRPRHGDRRHVERDRAPAIHQRRRRDAHRHRDGRRGHLPRGRQHRQRRANRADLRDRRGVAVRRSK